MRENLMKGVTSRVSIVKRNNKNRTVMDIWRGKVNVLANLQT